MNYVLKEEIISRGWWESMRGGEQNARNGTALWQSLGLVNSLRQYREAEQKGNGDCCYRVRSGHALLSRTPCVNAPSSLPPQGGSLVWLTGPLTAGPLASLLPALPPAHTPHRTRCRSPEHHVPCRRLSCRCPRPSSSSHQQTGTRLLIQDTAHVSFPL